MKYDSVIRYGPGCCGVDANCGFEVIWDHEYPDQDVDIGAGYTPADLFQINDKIFKN